MNVELYNYTKNLAVFSTPLPIDRIKYRMKKAVDRAIVFFVM